MKPMLLAVMAGLIITALLWYFADTSSPSEDMPAPIAGIIVAVIVYGMKREWKSS